METVRTETYTYTECDYQVHRTVRLSGSDQEIIIRRQAKDVITVEGTPCEVRGLRDDEIVSFEEKPAQSEL